MLIFNLHQICTLKLVWVIITKFLEIDVGEYFVLFYFQCQVTILFMSGVGRKSKEKVRGRPRILDPHYFNPN